MKRRKLNSQPTKSPNCNNSKNHISLDFPVFSKFLGSISVDKFFEEYWEKKPLYLRNDNDKNSPVSFKLEDLWKILEEKKGQIKYGEHLNVCSCRDGFTQVMHHEQPVMFEYEDTTSESSGNENGGEFPEIKKLDAENSIVSVDDLKKDWKESGGTIQFFHPQCYVDDFHSLLFDLECEFDCLWGANVYLTPKAAQGLAPHYDNSDVFIFQTEGKKEWFIYENTNMNEELCLESSLPLPKSRVGKLRQKYTLQVGDLLYLPRGTIHCAKSLLEGHSTHVTISTYQRHNYHEFATITLNNILSARVNLDRKLREGVPVGYRRDLRNSTEKMGQRLNSTWAEISSFLKSATLDGTLDGNSSWIQEVLERSLNEFSVDFAKSRLPPPDNHPLKLKYLELLPKSELIVGDKVKFLMPELFQFLFMDYNDAQAGKVTVLKIYSCFDNQRETHMGLNSNSEREQENGPEYDNCVSLELDKISLECFTALKSSTSGIEITEDNLSFLRVLNESNILMKI